MADYAARRRTMVDTQVRPSDVTKYPIIEAMLAVPREAFVPASARERAYAEENVPLGSGRVLLAPRTFAKMLDALAIGPGDLVLDLGAGLGYGAAVLSRMADAVIAVEEDEAMAAAAEAALAEVAADNAVVVRGPLVEGAARHGPYDALLVEGAVEHVPEALAAQMRDGARVAALFAEGSLTVCRLGVCAGGRISWRDAFTAWAPILPGFAATRSFAL